MALSIIGPGFGRSHQSLVVELFAALERATESGDPVGPRCFVGELQKVEEVPGDEDVQGKEGLRELVF